MMSLRTWSLPLVAAVALGTPLSAGAQRLSAPSFVFARYASGSATVLYAGRGFGAVGGVVAMVHNPRTLYREMIAGVYTQVSVGRQSMLVALAYADASDSRYLQTYLNPTITSGPLAMDATIEGYAPLEGSGTRQLSVNPVTALVRVERHLAVGIAATVDVAPGAAPQGRVGPAAEWRAKWGTFRVEVLRRSAGPAMEIRTGALAAF